MNCFKYALFIISIGVFFLHTNRSFAQVEGFAWFSPFQSGEGRSDGVKRVRTAANGDLIVCGEFRGVKDFDPGEGKLLKSTSNANTANAYLARYTPSGEPVWVRHLRAQSTFEVNGLDVDTEGNIYMGGYFNALLYPDEFDSEVVLVNNPEPNADLWTVSYDENGLYRWGQVFGGAAVDNIGAVAISGNQLIVGGIFSQTADLDPGPGVFEVATGGGSGQVPFIASYDKSNGTFNWGFDIGGSIGFNLIRDLDVDESGNIYVTGAFRSTKDFDPSPDSSFLLSSSGGDDIFVASYTPQGTFRWANRGGASGADTGIAVHYENGRLHLTGNFRFTSSFSGGADPVQLASAGDLDVFFARYDATTGELLSITGIGGPGSDSGEGVTTDADGNVVIAGFFNTAVDFAPGDDEVFELSGSGATGFMAAYNSDHELQWAIDIQSTGQIRIGDVKRVGNEIRVGGFYSVSADFDPSEETFIGTSAANNNTNLFVASYTQTNGAFLSGILCDDQVGGSLEVNSIEERLSGGIIASGDFVGRLHLPDGSDLVSSGAEDAFIASFNEQGGLLQVARLQASGSVRSRGLAIDADGNAYFIASFTGTGSFEGPGTSIPLGPTAGSLSRMVVVKLDEELDAVWLRTFEGTSLQIPIDIAIQGDDIAITGSFRGTTTFSDDWEVTSNGNDDVFLLKMNTTGDVDWAYGFGASGVEFALSVGFDAESNILMGCSLRFTVNLDPAGQAEPLLGSGSNRTAFASYTPDGTYRWAYLHGAGNQVRSFVPIDETRFVAYGQFTDGLFSTDEDDITLTSQGQADAYLAIYQNSGVLDTVFTLVGGPQNVEAWQMLAQAGVLHFCGSVRDGAAFAFGDEEIPVEAQFTRGFYATLNLESGALTADLSPNTVSTVIYRGLVLAEDEVYVGGTFSGNVIGFASFASTDGFVGLLGEPAVIEPEPCLGDFNEDGSVSSADLLLLLTDFGCASNCSYDLNNDGQVDVIDVLLFLTVFGTSCDQ